MPISSGPTNPLASIERHMVTLEHMMERQNITIAQLSDELAEAARREDWYHVQFSEMLRILARDLREVRVALICSLVGDGPINTQLMNLILRQSPQEMRDLDLAARSQGGGREN
jgi:hypothetical protein